MTSTRDLAAPDDAAGRLTEAVAHLVGASAENVEMMRTLDQLCETTARLVDADAVAVMGTGMGQTRFTRARRPTLASDRVLQAAFINGPARDAIDTEQPVVATSAHDLDQRWPDFATAVAHLGVQAVVYAPMMSRDRCWGLVELYWTRPHQPTAHELTSIQLQADVAGAYLAMALDRAQRRSGDQYTSHPELHDPVTGLPNRGLIHELLYHSVSASDRDHTPVAVLVVDIDDFDAVNRIHGRVAADGVLGEIAKRLRAVIRHTDTVGRLAGDAFLIVCDDVDTTQFDQPIVDSPIADRIRTVFTAPFHVPGSGESVELTASTGAALTLGSSAVSAADLLHQAGVALREAKATAPGGIVVSENRHDSSGADVSGLERSLFKALRRNELEVFYQPVVDRDGRVASVEALLRWRHPVRGLLAAGEFIALAESTGLIVAIGHWLIHETMQQLATWRRDTPDLAPERVFCNLSPQELIDPALTDMIDHALRQSGLTPADLGLEVVENHLADPRLLAAVHRLRNAGHPLAIDDFGTGYSSLSRLVDMPFTHLKIDRSLIAGLPCDQRSQTLIQAILLIAHGLDVQVICEGVENETQAAYLRAAGPVLLQGYHIGRPGPPDTTLSTPTSPASR